MVVVMTWLGRMLNAVLANGFKTRGFNVSDGSFHFALMLDDDHRVLPEIKEIVNDIIGNNPLGAMTTERMVDLGPHFRHLSESQQAKAREDWLDKDFLRRWCDNLTEVCFVAAESQVGVDLLELT
jgi:hypothetical protein